MKLTKQTDFALRTLIFLAENGEGRRVFAQEISAAYGMPLNHLTKIINKLGQLGYLNTYRGRNGGIELGKSKETISIRQVIEDFEPNLNPADCGNCVIKGECKLQKHLSVASELFLQSLGEKSLADMVSSQNN